MRKRVEVSTRNTYEASGVGDEEGGWLDSSLEVSVPSVESPELDEAPDPTSGEVTAYTAS